MNELTEELLKVKLHKLEGYRCIRSNYVSQGYGENQACINTGTGKVSSAKSDGTCVPPSIRLYQDYLSMKGHNGTDQAGIKGETGYFNWNFVGIAKTETDMAGGLGVRVKSIAPVRFPDGSIAYAIALYWHNLENLVNDGDIVKMGDPIFRVNSTGASSGHHVHEGLKKGRLLMGDAQWLDLQDRIKSIDTNNGYRGAVDTRGFQKFGIFVGDAVEVFQETEALLIKVQRVILLIQRRIDELKKAGSRILGSRNEIVTAKLFRN